jgi:hypothetical protein
MAKRKSTTYATNAASKAMGNRGQTTVSAILLVSFIRNAEDCHAVVPVWCCPISPCI